MAVELHALDRMIELISPVTYACPLGTLLGGCSLSLSPGTIHDTAGSESVCSAVKKWPNGSTFESWLSLRTVSNHGSGFQIPGVHEFCGTGAQNIWSLVQSGWPPCWT